MTLLPEDFLRCTAMAPPIVRELLKMDGVTCLAGGFIRAVIARERVSDVDLFVKPDKIDALSSWLFENLPSPKVHKTEFAHSFTSPALRYPIQLIYKWDFYSAYDVLDAFDFTISAAAIYWQAPIYPPPSQVFERDDEDPFANEDTMPGEFRSVVDDRFYADLAGRRLVYRLRGIGRGEMPGGSLLRAFKFARKGYQLSPDTLAEIVALTAAQACPDGWDPNHPGGPGDAFHDMAPMILRVLRKVDPLDQNFISWVLEEARAEADKREGES